MKKVKLYFILFLQFILLSSCLTTKQTNLLQQSGGNIPVYPPMDAIGEYKIKRGDELNIQVRVPQDNANTASLFSLFTNQNVKNTGDADRLRTLTVSPQGSIYFPYLGNIQVVDKTTLEIQQIIESKINQDILTIGGCIVSVSLANRYFSVIGESKAGRYPIAKEQLTIFQALSQSGDINPYGDRSKVRVIRQNEGNTIIKTFDLRSADIVNSEFYYIQPNDVIYIQPLKRQFLGMNSFGAIFAVTSTVVSFGLMIYNIAK